VQKCLKLKQIAFVSHLKTNSKWCYEESYRKQLQLTVQQARKQLSPDADRTSNKPMTKAEYLQRRGFGSRQ
jgi:hypothetical protein